MHKLRSLLCHTISQTTRRTHKHSEGFKIALNHSTESFLCFIGLSNDQRCKITIVIIENVKDRRLGFNTWAMLVFHLAPEGRFKEPWEAMVIEQCPGSSSWCHFISWFLRLELQKTSKSSHGKGNSSSKFAVNYWPLGLQSSTVTTEEVNFNSNAV